MQKLLFFILLLVGIYYWRRSLLQDDSDKGSRRSSSQSAQAPEYVETMLACAHCGLLVPRSEGIESADAFFCSAEHARLGPGAPSV